MHRTTLFTPPPPRQTGGPRGRDDALPAVGRTGTGADHLHPGDLRHDTQTRFPSRRWLWRPRQAGPHGAHPLEHRRPDPHSK